MVGRDVPFLDRQVKEHAIFGARGVLGLHQRVPLNREAADQRLEAGIGFEDQAGLENL